VHELEFELNQLLNDYVALVWNFLAVGDHVHGTVVLLHQGEMRKAALMQQPIMHRSQ